jgi:hypothetical protein
MVDWLTRNEAMALIGAETVSDAACAQILLAHLQLEGEAKGAGPSALYSREAVERAAEELKACALSKALGSGSDARARDAIDFTATYKNDRGGELTYGPGLKVGDSAYVNKYGNACPGDDPEQYCPTARVAFVDKDGWVLLEAMEEEVPF